MLKNSKVLMLISLLISIVLWLYVMGNVDPVVKAHINDIPVTVSGQETLKDLGISATLDSPKTVNITVKGKRSYVNTVKKKGISVSVDVSTCDMGENTAPIDIEMPSGVVGITVEDISETEATFTVK